MGDVVTSQGLVSHVLGRHILGCLDQMTKLCPDDDAGWRKWWTVYELCDSTQFERVASTHILTDHAAADLTQRGHPVM